jgi:hypothetical protein
MLKAYLGVASKQGLSLFQPERADTLAIIRHSLRSGDRALGFWAVVGERDVQSINALFVNGHRKEAMALLDRCARDLGPIMPSDLSRLSTH